MIRLGVIDFDTSHVVEFTKRLNKKGVGKDQFVEGAAVVLGCPGASKIMPERIAVITKDMRDLGVPLVGRPGDMIGKIDGVLIESQEGGAHYERARPFLEAGLPCFIDKPFACSLADARKIVALAARHKAPVFSSSSLRYAPGVVAYLDDKKRGAVIGAVAYGPAPYYDGKSDVPLNPGLYHYGVHAVEILYALMGPGCVRVSCLHEKDVDVVTGRWKDGRAGTVRGSRSGKPAYGFTAFAANGVRHEELDTRHIYRDLLKQVVAFFQAKKAPVDPATTVEMMGFIEAALRSAGNHGAGEAVSP